MKYDFFLVCNAGSENDTIQDLAFCNKSDGKRSLNCMFS